MRRSEKLAEKYAEPEAPPVEDITGLYDYRSARETVARHFLAGYAAAADELRERAQIEIHKNLYEWNNHCEDICINDMVDWLERDEK